MTMKTFTVSHLEVHVSETRLEMGVTAGRAVEKKILELLDKQEEIRMIFAAAPSQNELLAYLRNSTRIPWHRITAFHMDEYIGLPPDAPQLFSNFLKERLFDHVNFKEVHLMNGSHDSKEECSRYAALLIEKPIDIVCLGIGENGHIAFNDPPVADFDDPEIMKVVELDQTCRKQQVNDGCFSSLKEVPRQAPNLTIPTLMKGHFLYCVVPGKTKRAAVAKTLYDPVSTDCPASILRTHPNCQMYIDTESFGNGEVIFE